ncbi:MAG: tRNA epoxyqueuosine(34) reductase QueG [Pseudomonadota bacterium]
MNRLRLHIEREAKALGFDAWGIALPDALPELPSRLAKALAGGHHASMHWIAETAHRRADPKTLWPDVRSIIMLAINYGPESDPLPLLQQRERGVISVYARHRDYHDLIKGRLKTLAAKLLSRARQMGHNEEQVKVFVDTAPVMEKPWAQQAGLGWQGKHTNVVSREFGSWLFLGSIFTTLDLPADASEVDHCGNCRKCLDICPTDAFPAPYQLDANRCISYLTIEHHGPIDEALRPLMGNRIYGCDDCLAVCPWNKFATPTREPKLAAPEGAEAASQLADLLALDDVTFRNRFSGSPVKRIGIKRFLRNTLIAAGNSATPALLAPVQALCEDEDETVRDQARWSATRLKEIMP